MDNVWINQFSRSQDGHKDRHEEEPHPQLQ